MRRPALVSGPCEASTGSEGVPACAIQVWPEPRALPWRAHDTASDEGHASLARFTAGGAGAASTVRGIRGFTPLQGHFIIVLSPALHCIHTCREQATRADGGKHAHPIHTVHVRLVHATRHSKHQCAQQAAGRQLSASAAGWWAWRRPRWRARRRALLRGRLPCGPPADVGGSGMRDGDEG